MVDINLMPEKIKGESVGLGDFLSRNAALAFAVSILIFSFIICLGLIAYGEIFLSKKGIELENKIEAINKDIEDSLPLLSKAQAFETRLRFLKNDEETGLLDRHVYFSNLFQFLEEMTHSDVSFSSFSVSSGTGQISLPAQAASYLTVAEQLIAIEKNEKVELVSFGGISINPDRGVNFSFTIKIDPEIFRE